jgi:hypothetical protein
MHAYARARVNVCICMYGRRASGRVVFSYIDVIIYGRARLTCMEVCMFVCICVYKFVSTVIQIFLEQIMNVC